MTMRGGLLVLGILFLAGAGLFAARQLDMVRGPWAGAGAGTESIELVLQADGGTLAGGRVEADVALDNAREIIARRLEAFGAREASVSRQGANRILVRVAGIKDPAAVRALVLARGRVELRLLDPYATPEQIESGRAPLGSEILPWSREGGEGPDRIAVQRRALVTGGMIEAAQQTFDQAGAPAVLIRLTDEGARRFAQVTAENVGKPLAFLLDDVVLWIPTITQPITGGEVQITGNLSLESAKELEILINAGALPIRLAVVEEKAPARPLRD